MELNGFLTYTATDTILDTDEDGPVLTTVDDTPMSNPSSLFLDEDDPVLTTVDDT